MRERLRVLHWCKNLLSDVLYFFGERLSCNGLLTFLLFCHWVLMFLLRGWTRTREKILKKDKPLNLQNFTGNTVKLKFVYSLRTSLPVAKKIWEFTGDNSLKPMFDHETLSGKLCATVSWNEFQQVLHRVTQKVETGLEKLLMVCTSSAISVWMLALQSFWFACAATAYVRLGEISYTVKLLFSLPLHRCRDRKAFYFSWNLFRKGNTYGATPHTATPTQTCIPALLQITFNKFQRVTAWISPRQK